MSTPMISVSEHQTMMDRVRAAAVGEIMAAVGDAMAVDVEAMAAVAMAAVVTSLRCRICRVAQSRMPTRHHLSIHLNRLLGVRRSGANVSGLKEEG